MGWRRMIRGGVEGMMGGGRERSCIPFFRRGGVLLMLVRGGWRGVWGGVECFFFLMMIKKKKNRGGEDSVGEMGFFPFSFLEIRINIQYFQTRHLKLGW